MATRAELLERIIKQRQRLGLDGSTTQPMGAPIEQPEVQVVKQLDEGEIYKIPGGGLGFKSPGYSTTNPENVKALLQGKTTVDELIKAGKQEQIITQAPIASRAAAALKGIPFIGEYADEIAGKLSGEEAQAMMRFAQEAMQETRPGETAALQVGTGVAATLPAAAATAPIKGASMLGTMTKSGLAGAGIGATEGAVSGFGAGETPEERTQEAQERAIFGTGVGGALGFVSPAVIEGLKNAAVNLKGKANTTIAKYFGIDEDSAKVLKNVLENEDFDTAAQLLDEIGSTSLLADAPVARQILDAAMQADPAAGVIGRKAVENRLTEYRRGLDTTMDTILGKPEGIAELQRTMRTATAGERDDLYKKAYAIPINYAGDRGLKLENMIRTRVPAQAIRKANETLRTEGLESKQILANIADDGKITFERLPDVQQIDYITRALNDLVSEEPGALRGQTYTAKAKSNLSRDIRKLLKEEVPAYRQALEQSASDIKRVQAVEIGQKALQAKITREEFARDLADANTVEKKAAKQGLRQYIDDTLANVNRIASDPNVESRELRKLTNEALTRSSQAKMELLLGKRQADKLYKELEKSILGLELKAAIARNSATATRQAIKGTIEDISTPGVVGTLLEGAPAEASKKFVQVFTERTPEAQALRQAGIYQTIANVLVNTKGERAKEGLRLIRRAQQGEALTRTQAEVLARIVTSQAAIAAFKQSQKENPIVVGEQ